MWFPRPASPADVEIVGASAALTPQQIFDLLTEPSAIEWKEKVGVVGPVEGSAKSWTRLLASNSWVLKTSLDSASEDKLQLVELAEKAARLGARSSFWHPKKVWGVYRSDDLWYPLSVTPEVSTLRRVGDINDKIRAWTAMLEMCVEVGVKNGIGLDINPANFGRDADGSSLYYIDDEWYAEFKLSELASGIVGRIPEEPDLDESEWASWGSVLFSVLAPACTTDDRWNELWDKVASHPITAKFESRRAALHEALREGHNGYRERKEKLASRRNSASQEPSRTAVIADVHGNAFALDAVLEACKDHGVDSYLFLGDAVGYGPQPKECIQKLAELPNAMFVRGNHDHAIGTGVLKEGMNRLARSCAEWTYNQLDDGERQWLLQMPLDVQGPGWVGVHGAPKDPKRFLAYVYELTFQDNLEHMAAQKLQLCFCGHTHVQFVHAKIPDGESQKLGVPESIDLNRNRVLIVNPGSVGQPRDGDSRAAFGIWDRAGKSISLHRAAYSVESTVNALKAADLPEGLGERLLQGR